jgi:phage baseplate assembly protein W
LTAGKNAKLMDPEWGIDLYRYLFEFVDELTAMMMKHDIEYGLELYEPRVKNVNVEVIPYEQQNTFLINISCVEILTNSQIELLNIDFKKIY